MTDAINTNNPAASNAVPTDTRNKAAESNERSSTASKPAEENKSNPATIVELSNPSLLQNIAEKIDKIPEVNEARVDSIKQSLIQGDYKPDAEVIARKFSEIENLLP